ncbi:MAG TPA: MoaD/ThiS family protein [Fimbriimonas sp.]
MKIKVRYFAVFRESRGRSSEEVETSSATPDGLYRELGLPLEARLVRAAVNGEFVEMESPLKEGDEVVFIPPVAGG